MIRLTRAGWIFIALTLFLGFSAVNTGNNLIYIIVSGFLSLMAVSGFFGRHNLKCIEADIEFADEVYAMTETSVRVRMMNKKKFMPAFLLKANLLGKEALFYYLDPAKDETKTVQAVFSKRGINSVSSITVCSVFPFNFFVRCVNVQASKEVLVLPRLIKCSLTQAAQHGKRQAEGLHSDSRGYESGIISLRLYQAGDPLRHIHWKAAAKTDKLLTKEF
ncbi:MAG: DUF58 domain-containing protein, partial [Nitrospiraceae bacterium]|nr:DUF58 domain-containing protein [Nitrospiraceae bacterium]